MTVVVEPLVRSARVQEGNDGDHKGAVQIPCAHWPAARYIPGPTATCESEQII